MEEIKLSVVIPTYNRKAKLKNLLLSIEKNFRIKSLYEIIVIDDASTDGTDKMIEKEFTYVKYYRHNNIELDGKSKNDGINYSSGDLILFIDVIKSNPNFLPTERKACRLNEENLPLHGTIAPSRIDLL